MFRALSSRYCCGCGQAVLGRCVGDDLLLFGWLGCERAVSQQALSVCAYTAVGGYAIRTSHQKQGWLIGRAPSRFGEALHICPVYGWHTLTCAHSASMCPSGAARRNMLVLMTSLHLLIHGSGTINLSHLLITPVWIFQRQFVS